MQTSTFYKKNPENPMIYNMNNNFKGNSSVTSYAPFRIFWNMCLKHLTDWSKTVQLQPPLFKSNFYWNQAVIKLNTVMVNMVMETLNMIRTSCFMTTCCRYMLPVKWWYEIEPSRLDEGWWVQSSVVTVATSVRQVSGI